SLTPVVRAHPSASAMQSQAYLPVFPMRLGRFGSCFQAGTSMWRALFASVLLALTACVADGPVHAAKPEPLYFAVEVYQGGKRLGAPKLLGLSGKRIT